MTIITNWYFTLIVLCYYFIMLYSKDILNELIELNLIGQCNYKIISNYNEITSFNNNNYNPIIAFYNHSIEEYNEYRDLNPVTLTGVNSISLGQGIVKNRSTAYEWVNNSMNHWNIPSNHPRNNQRNICISMSLSSIDSPKRFYDDNINKIQPFYLMKFTNVYINELGIIALKCGYWQAHESCETIFKFIGRKWRSNCIVHDSNNTISCPLVDKPIEQLPSKRKKRKKSKKVKDTINAHNESNSLLFNISNIPTAVQFVKKIFVITAAWDHNYHHFIVDSLVRLYRNIDMLKSNTDIYIHIRGFEKFTGQESYYFNGISMRKRIIDLLGFNINRFITGPVFGEVVYMPRAISCNSQVSHALELRALSKYLLIESYKKYYNLSSNYLSSDIESYRLKYQDNQKSLIIQHRYCSVIEECDGWREWTNDFLSHVVNAFSSTFNRYNIKVISSNDKNISDCLYCQIIMYSNADIVIGVHGAGMTNIMFMRPGSLLVEIVGQFDGRMLPHCGYHGPLASVYGIHHYIYYYDYKGGEQLNMTDVALKIFYDV